MLMSCENNDPQSIFLYFSAKTKATTQFSSLNVRPMNKFDVLYDWG